MLCKIKIEKWKKLLEREKNLKIVRDVSKYNNIQEIKRKLIK